MLEYKCCDYQMEKLCHVRDVDIHVTVFWCGQCGRVVQTSTAGELTMSKTFTPLDAYKSIGRECLG